MKYTVKSRIAPKSNVYRVAAEMIQKKEVNFSCIAIYLAVDKVYVKENYTKRKRISSMYVDQYTALFGTPVDAADSLNYLGNCNQNLIKTVSSEKSVRHPFWNKTVTFSNRKVRESRVNALLLMAEVVEQGV